MEFMTCLIKTPEDSEFLTENCTHVAKEYWIFEGDQEFLEDELNNYEVIADGCVPSLGDLTTKELGR